MKTKASTIVYLPIWIIAWTVPHPSALHARTLDPPAIAASAPLPQADQARAALDQGRALLRRGNADQALGYLETALKVFADAKDEKGVATAHDALGELYELQGQYEVALGHYKAAYEAFVARASKPSAARAFGATVGLNTDSYNANLMLAKIGNMYYRAGKLSDARDTYARMTPQKPDTSTLGKTKRAGGLFGSITSLGSAKPSASTALGTASTIAREFEFYRQTIVYATYEIGLGRADYTDTQNDRAKKHFENALAALGSNLPIVGQFGQIRRFRTAARTSLGDISFRQGRFADAIKLYAEAAKGARDDKRLDLQWPAQRGIGRSLWAQAAQEKDQAAAAKLREDSLAAYREALKTIETIRAGSLRADESRTTFLATTKDAFAEAASGLAEMALTSASSPTAPLEGKALDYAAEAFKITEQGRARSLLDLLGETGASITEGLPADLLKRKQENLDRQQEIARELTGINVSEDAPKQPLDKLEVELETLQTEYDSLENQIRSASPRYAALTAPQPLTLAEVQQQVLDDRMALLEYNLGDERSYLWAATRRGVALYRLPSRSALDKQVVELRAQVIPAKLRRAIVGIDAPPAQTERGLGSGAEGASAFAAASYALYKTAVEPAAPLLTDKRLLIVADGALNYVPFGALVTTAGGADYAALPYLIKTNEIVSAPSASVIAAVKQQAGKPADRGILLVADPVFNASDPRAQGAGAGSQSRGSETRGLALASALTDVADTPAGERGAGTAWQLLRLKGTRAEAEQIAQLTRTSGGQVDVWLDLDASKDNLKTRDIKKYRIVHIATHGLLNAERPQFTGLVLSLVGNRSGEDGFLRTNEVFNLNLGARLVMLSACETGLGKEKRGEGVMGLTRAFMYAGAPAVGVSLWSVADRSTAELMTDFYKALMTQGQSPAAAMRTAQLKMIAGKRYSAPFFWAPFVLVGEGTAEPARK